MIGSKWILAAVLAIGTLPAAAQAQYPFLGYGYGVQPGYGQGYFPGSSARPPYFALHPPVYYSHAIDRRPVGPSPFAYPSWYSPACSPAAEQRSAQPLLIVNPFVKKAAAAEASAASEVSAPANETFILNPFAAQQ